MREQIGQWLVAEFSIFGVRFQNWMPVAFGIILVAILLASRKKRSE
jgi:hypothetical protein